MDKSLVTVNRKDPRTTIISLNRPEKRNALNIDLMEELWEVIDESQHMPQQRVIVIQGEGSVFCSGLDLQEAADESKVEKSAHLIAKILSSLYNSPLVTIAAVQGAAIAGGAGLMMACDLVVAESDTIFGFPEVRRGLVAAQLIPFFWRQLQQRVILELLLLGEIINADKALAMGLINRIVEKHQLQSETKKISDIIFHGAPGAIAETKNLIREMYPTNFTEDIKKGLQVHEMIRHSSEAKEGIAAFFEHRQPKWLGET